jgi:hypothetical protein
MPAPQTGQTPRAMGRPLALVVYVTRCIGWVFTTARAPPDQFAVACLLRFRFRVVRRCSRRGVLCRSDVPVRCGWRHFLRRPRRTGRDGRQCCGRRGVRRRLVFPVRFRGRCFTRKRRRTGRGRRRCGGRGVRRRLVFPVRFRGRCFTWGRRRTGRGGRRYGGRGWMRRGGWRQGRSDGRRCCAARCDQRLPSPGDFPPHQPQDRHNCRQAQQTPDG